MKYAYDIIKKPIITERSMMGAQDNKYTFEVAIDAGKVEIKKAVEEIFGVKVAKVNTIKLPGKWKRMGVHVGKRSDIKKAVVTLTAVFPRSGFSIESACRFIKTGSMYHGFYTRAKKSFAGRNFSQPWFHPRCARWNLSRLKTCFQTK